jgi:hypothetical protein
MLSTKTTATLLKSTLDASQQPVFEKLQKSGVPLEEHLKAQSQVKKEGQVEGFREAFPCLPRISLDI